MEQPTAVKARIAVAVFLLVLGIGLPLAAVSSRGAPWGFRGHQAVLVEATGTVEVARGETVIPPKAGLFLDAGAELRVGRYAEARLSLPSGQVIARDGARVVLAEGGAGKPTLILSRGLVDVSVRAGTTPFEVKVDGVDASLVLRPGGQTDGKAAGEMRVLADGKGVRAWARAGSVEGRASGGDASAESGKVVIIGADKKPRVDNAPTAIAAPATCVAGALVVEAPEGSQVFVNGTVQYAEAGKVEVNVGSRATVPVLVRDVVGNALHQNVACVDKVEKPRLTPRPLVPAPRPTPKPAPKPGAVKVP